MALIAARRLLLQGRVYEPGEEIAVPVRRSLINQGWVYDPENPRHIKISLRRKMPKGLPGGKVIAGPVAEPAVKPEAKITEVITEPEVTQKLAVEKSTIDKTTEVEGQDISELSARKVREMIDKLDNLDLLYRLLAAEDEGKARKTVIAMVEKRIGKLEGSD